MLESDAERPRVVIVQFAPRDPLVQKLKPQEPARETADQELLRDGGLAADMRDQLALDVAQKPAFARAAVDLVAERATPEDARLGG